MKPSQKPLQLDELDDITCKFIEIYSKFPELYDGDHPYFGKYDKKQKAISSMQSILLSDHDIHLEEDILSEALDQLQSWYYSARRLVFKTDTKLSECHKNYFEMCKFLPKKQKKIKIVCNICNQKFFTDKNLKHHLWRSHQVGDCTFQCDQCGKKLVSKPCLKRHIRRQHEEKKFACKTCGKLFALSHELTVHTRVHTAEKPHVCELCGKCFRLKYNLGLHNTRVHTKIRAFKCTMCPKEFFKNSHLSDHIKSHLGIRDKICKVCGKGFSNHCLLMRHRRIHAEVRKYSCKLCESKFNQSVGLNGHMKRIHNIVTSKIDTN